MDLLEAIILGIIQGLTEFLPVSSSGHLELAKAILGDNSIPEESLTFTVVLHFATALSTLVVFRKEIAQIVGGLFQFKINSQFLFSLKIIVSMIPAALVGFYFEHYIDVLFQNQLLLVGFMLLLTAGLLYLTDKKSTVEPPTNKLKDPEEATGLSFKKAFIVGLAQMAAILPGLSRSGATISTAVLLNIDKTQAAKFSFLMVVPLIFGKIAKDILDGNSIALNADFLPMALGFFAALITGIAACVWMIDLVKRSKLKYFALYCLLVGLIAIVSDLMSTH